MQGDVSREAAARWDDRYRSGDTPWDTGLVSQELVKFLDRERVPVGHAVELGCGTGTNALELSRRGFRVSAADCSAVALKQARIAASADPNIEFFEVDVRDWEPEFGSCDFVFDRGCYHCVRRTDLAGYLRTLQHLARPGTPILLLAGNDREVWENGPPTVSEDEIREEFAAVCELIAIREFHFEDAGGQRGPLGWSCHFVWGAC